MRDSCLAAGDWRFAQVGACSKIEIGPKYSISHLEHEISVFGPSLQITVSRLFTVMYTHVYFVKLHPEY